MKRKTWIGWGIALGLVAALYLFGAGALRAQMEDAMSSACNRPVSIRSARITLPPGILLSGIEVPPAPRESAAPFSIGQLSAHLAAGQFLQGKVGLSVEVQRPRLVIQWTPQAKLLFSPDSFKNAAGSAPMPLARLKIEGGELTFVDETVLPAVSWNFRDLQAEVSADRGPGEYSVHLSARMVGDAQENLGKVGIDGSVISQGPVDGTVSVEHLKIERLSPYLRRILGAAPTQGQAQLTSRVTVDHGVAMTHNEVIASGVVFPNGERTTLDLEGNRLVELLRDPEGKIHLGFIVTGKLGGKLDWSDLAAGALREAMRQALSKSIQNVLQQSQDSRPAGEVLQEKLESIGR